MSQYLHDPFASCPSSPWLIPYPPCRPLDVESWLGSSLVLDLRLGESAIYLLDPDELLDFHDHAGELGVDGVEDGLGAAAEAEGG